MNRGPITVRYARGLFELGKDKDILDELFNNSRQLLDHCREVKDFCSFLNSPTIKPSKKKQVLQKTLGNELHAYMLRFLDLVIEKKRETLLQDILLFFGELFRKHEGIKSVNLITATALEKEHLENLKVFLERELNAPIDLNALVNPEILGGIILIVDGKILDNSIAHQMSLIKKKLLS